MTLDFLPLMTLAPPNPRLRERAEALEGAFLAEMLRHTGLGAGGAEGFGSLRGPFGGGIGEEQFASFLREAMAGRMVDAGGIGLAESLMRALGPREG